MQPTITEVNPRTGTVTVKMDDPTGHKVEKTFQLTEDLEYVDSTGRIATLDVFRCGEEVLFVATEGQIEDLKRATRMPSGRTEPMPTQTGLASGDKAPNRPSVSAEDIRFRAYEKWESAGKPTGDGVPFWLDAEKELLKEKSPR